MLCSVIPHDAAVMRRTGGVFYGVHACGLRAMGEAARLLTHRLHAYEISCFWWQLLSSLAALEGFEPRDLRA